MRGLPALIIDATVPGWLLLNQIPAGEVGPEASVSLPMTTDGTCYLTFMPISPGYQSMCRKIVLADGRPLAPDANDPNVSLVLWPQGVVEVHLSPPEGKTARMHSLIPEAVQRVDVYVEGRRHTVSLVRHQGMWLVVEDSDGMILLDQALAMPQADQLRAVRCGGQPSVLVEGMDAQERTYSALAVWYDGSWQLIREGLGNAESGDDTAVLETMGDTLGHRVRWRWQNNGLQRELIPDGSPHNPATQEETALAFLEAIAIGSAEEASSYLSSPLREGLDTERVLTFLGAFDRIIPCRYAMVPPGNPAYAVLRKVANGMEEALPYAFAMVEETTGSGTFKIDNILPLYTLPTA